MHTFAKALAGSLLALAVCLSAADAQPPAESVAALEAQLSLLKKMTAEVEAKLDKAKAARPKRPGFPKFDPEKVAKLWRGFEKKVRPAKKDDVEARLDRLAKEIEEIRRSLKK